MKCSLLIAVFAAAGCSGTGAARPSPAVPPPGATTASPTAGPTSATPVFTPSIPPESPTTEKAKGSPRYAVKAIGMHIGGGPNDAKTKAPFELALRGAFDAVARCCESSGCANGTFGLDLLVGKDGGRPEVSGVRTAFPEATASCMAAALGSVQFATPKLGATKLSYSIRVSETAP